MGLFAPISDPTLPRCPPGPSRYETDFSEVTKLGHGGFGVVVLAGATGGWGDGEGKG